MNCNANANFSVPNKPSLKLQTGLDSLNITPNKNLTDSVKKNSQWHFLILFSVKKSKAIVLDWWLMPPAPFCCGPVGNLVLQVHYVQKEFKKQQILQLRLKMKKQYFT